MIEIRYIPGANYDTCMMTGTGANRVGQISGRKSDM